MRDAVNTQDRFVRESECAFLTGLSKQRRWILRREGHFPEPVKLSERTIAWRYSDIEAWMDSRQPASIQRHVAGEAA